MRMKDTKKRILQQSILLFGQEGFDRVSVRQIAGAVGIKESSIYNHYSSKAEILEDILQEFKKRHMSYWVKKEDVHSALKTKPLREVLRLFFYYYSEAEYNEIISMYRIVFMEQYRQEESRDLMLNFLMKKQTAHMVEIFEDLIEMGYLKPIDVPTLATAWVNVTFVLVLEATHVARSDTDPDKLFDLMIDMMMQYATEKGKTVNVVDQQVNG